MLCDEMVTATIFDGLVHSPDVGFDLKTRIRLETCIQKNVDGIACFVRVEFVNQIGA